MLLSEYTCINTINAWKLIGIIVMIIKVLVPVIIIITSTIPVFNALVKGTLDELTGSMKKIFMKIMAGVIVFLMPTLISSTIKLLAGSDGKTDDVIMCVECFEDPNGGGCQEGIDKYNELEEADKNEDEEREKEREKEGKEKENSIKGGSIDTDSYAGGTSSDG